MDYYRNVSILVGSIKDEEFLDRLSNCQLIKEDCFMETVSKRIRNYEFQNCPLLSYSFPSVPPSPFVTNSPKAVRDS
jgi:hypothetical protein